MPLGLENPFHLLILLVVVLLFFGAKRLPEMGRSLGKGMREFKDGVVGREPPELPSRPTSQSGVAQTDLAEPVAKSDGQ
jgi:sec-independent protein translocase protein TatA